MWGKTLISREKEEKKPKYAVSGKVIMVPTNDILPNPDQPRREYSYQKLLEEGDFTREKKAENKRNEPFVVFYWCLVLAVYLGLSFVTRRWDTTWIVWPVMAVLFGAALALKSMLQKKP